MILGDNTISLHEKGKYAISEYNIQSEADAIKIIEEMRNYFKNIGRPLIESYCDINTLDKIINEKPDEPLFGVRGLILAKLSGTPNYVKLKEAYRQLFVDKE